MEVKLSRKILLILIAVGALFLASGIAFAIGFVTLEVTNSLGMIAFNTFSIVIGLVLIISQGWYFLNPPTLLKITADELIFATGMRYVPFAIPRKYFRNAAVSTVGLSIYFNEDKAIPSSKVTSAGVGYYNYCLSLGALYMSKNPAEVVEFLSRS